MAPSRTRRTPARGQAAGSPAVHVKRRRQIGVAMFDPHGGYRFGLMGPDVVLPPLGDNEEEWTPRPTAIQKRLWKWYEADRKAVTDLAGGDDVFVLAGGDVIQGTLLRDQMLVTPRLSDQFVIAENFLEPWLKIPNFKFMRLIKGTAVHVMNKGSAELSVAHNLKKQHGKDVSAWYHMDLRAYGVHFDVSHHGPNTGKREWLRGNELRYYVRSIMLAHMDSGHRPPDIVLRGHYHDRTIELVHQHTWGETFKTWGAVSPAYSLFDDDYTKKATQSKSHMTAGLLAVEIIDGRIKEVWDFAHTFDLRRHEVVD